MVTLSSGGEEEFLRLQAAPECSWKRVSAAKQRDVSFIAIKERFVKPL